MCPLIPERKPPILRRRLGRRIRRLRESAGLTLDEAAQKLEKPRSSLHRYEIGESRLDVHVARSMMDIYDVYDSDLLDLVREALKPRWFRRYSPEDMGYVDIETEASVVKEFAVLNVPGLLQTEAYMREIFRATARRTKHELDNQVKVRTIRQERLTSEDDPLELVALIDEAALRRQVGGPTVMRAQLRHLIDAVALRRVELQVLALRNGPHSALDGAFTVVSFPEPDEPDLLYAAYATGSLHVEKPEEVTKAKLMFDRLRGEALSPAGSIVLIQRLASELYGD